MNKAEGLLSEEELEQYLKKCKRRRQLRGFFGRLHDWIISRVINPYLYKYTSYTVIRRKEWSALNTFTCRIKPLHGLLVYYWEENKRIYKTPNPGLSEWGAAYRGTDIHLELMKKALKRRFING